MSESSGDAKRRASWPAWTSVAVIGLLLAGGITWGILSSSASQVAGGPSASAGASLPAATPQPTDVETPTPGATESVEKPDPGEEVPIDEPAPPVRDAIVEVTSVEAVTAGRDIPGEQSGPAVKVTVRVSNEGTKPLDTAGASVSLTYGGDDRTPAVAVTDDAATVFPETIAPGEDATAVYIFAVPLASEDDMRVIVDLLASEPDVVFVGPRP